MTGSRAPDPCVNIHMDAFFDLLLSSEIRFRFETKGLLALCHGPCLLSSLRISYRTDRPGIIGKKGQSTVVLLVN